MAGYNRIIIIGNLTRDPDYKQLASGQGVCQLGLASNRQYRNKQTGNMVQEVCFVDVDVFGPQAESCNQYLKKGRAVLVEGRLKFDSWETPEGQKRSKHSIVADRVVFLASTEVEADGERSQIEKVADGDLAQKPTQEFNAARVQEQAVAPKRKNTSKKVEQKNEEESFDGGELAFQDEPPFQDDLPF